MRLSERTIFRLLLGVLCIIAYFSFFHQLDRLSIRVWDEASYALNAQEMLEDGNLLVLQEFGHPDLYNTKPPLAVWCMAVSIRFLGLNELGVRIPAAVFAFLSALLLFLAGARILKNSIMGFVAALILCGSDGFVNWHIARSGDTDAILSFWILASVISFFLYTETASPRWIVLTTLAICAACLTKGISGMMILPALVIWIFATHKQHMVFRSKYFWLSILLFLIIVPGYYILRENLAPGYLRAVMENEIGGRLRVQENINYYGELPFFAYLNDMVAPGRFMPWIWLVPVALFGLFAGPPSAAKRFGILLGITAAIIFIFLGISKTKLAWYDAPLYPLLAILIATGFHILITFAKIRWIRPAAIGLLLLTFIFPWVKIVRRNIHEADHFYFAAFFKKIRSQNSGPLFVADRHMVYPIHFYLKQDSLRGFHSRMVRPDVPLLKKDDLVITINGPRMQDIQRWYQMDILAEENDCRLFRINALKKDAQGNQYH